MSKLLKFIRFQGHSWLGIPVLLLLFILSFPVFAQQGNIKINGRILDRTTKEPIIGATVLLVKEKTGTATDSNGKFTLNAKSFPASVRVNSIGYRPVSLIVNKDSEPITIYLSEDLEALSEVVVIGYGTQKRKELTGSISSISKTTLAQPTTSFDNLLSGSVAGLNITQGGQPGSASSIRIRGGNSINAGNEPLYVVDGVILYGTSATDAGVSRVSGGLNPLAAINPNDIESIEVLKDVSATAIYGSRGSNGVIIVTTKNGKKGKDKIEYQYSVGWQQANKKLDLLNASQWAALNQEIAPTGFFNGYSNSQIAALGEGYDWQSAALRTAINQNHQISFSGGDDKTHYLISGNYTNQDGILLNTDFKRYSGRFNFDRDVLKNLKVSLNLNASKLNQNGLNTYSSYASAFSGSTPFEQIIRTSPNNPIYNADGSFNYSNTYELGDLRNGTKTSNGLSDLANTTAKNTSDALLGNFSVRYSILPNLVLKADAGTNITDSRQDYYAPSYTSGGFNTKGYASVGSRRTEIWQQEFTLNYTKQLNEDNYIDALAGYTAQKTSSEYATASSANFANEELLWNSLQSGSTAVTPTSGGYESVLNSYIGRVNYTFKKRYNLTATFRADGSSRFASNHKWGYFPSVGLSWNIHEEPFFKGIKSINDFKLRASFGTVGNQEIGDYKYEATYGTADVNDSNRNQVYSLNGNLVTGYLRTNLENPDLKWESTAAFNVGFDLSLFNSRLNFVADAYYKKTFDLLLNVPVEITTGFNSVLRNAGSLSNRGIEFEARGSIIETPNLKWSVTANIAKNINKVLDLGGQSNINNAIFVGQPLGAQYLVVFNGIVQQSDDLTKIAPPSWKTKVEAGDEKFVDQNGDKVVDQTSDRVILGTSNPDITYGFSTTLSYKSFSLFASFQGVSGNKIYNSLRQTLETPSVSYNGLSTLLDRWTTTNPSNSIPKARTTTGATYATSRFLEDGAFLRLKNISLNYTLPIKIQTNPSAKFNVFASAQNLFTWTKFTGFDPETGGGYAYPLARTISLGINVSY